MCETLSELLLLLLLRLFPLSFTKTEGKRLALLEQSAAGEISLELVPHGGQKVELLSPSSTGNNFSHLRTLFPSPLKKKGTLEGMVSRFSAKFPEMAETGCHVHVCCGSCGMIHLVLVPQVIIQCCRVEVTWRITELQSGAQRLGLKTDLTVPFRSLLIHEQLWLHSFSYLKMHRVYP